MERMPATDQLLTNVASDFQHSQAQHNLVFQDNSKA